MREDRRNACPDENQEAYTLLFCLENCLRELVIEELSTSAGPMWYKQRLPAAAVEKYKRSVEVERKTRWSQLIPHHPIYYIDFAHLREIIVRGDNWAACFERIFRSKDFIMGTLSELEFVRNKVAHSRRVSALERGVVANGVEQLFLAIGDERVLSLMSKRTTVANLIDQLRNLRTEARLSLQLVRDLSKLEGLPIWGGITGRWWFDESYLGVSLRSIEQYFETLRRYVDFPRKRGSGHELEAWVKSVKIESQFSSAEASLASLLD